MTDNAVMRHPFYFLRHGETERNAAGLVSGQSDIPLSARGRAQALAIVDPLLNVGIASVWCSPMLRARTTIQPFIDRSGLRLTILDGLAERDWGAWEGTPTSELRRDATPPGGESPEAFQARVMAALAVIDGPRPALIVAHAGVGRTIAGWLTGDGDRGHVRNATLYRCEPGTVPGTGWFEEA